MRNAVRSTLQFYNALILLLLLNFPSLTLLKLPFTLSSEQNEIIHLLVLVRMLISFLLLKWSKEEKSKIFSLSLYRVITCLHNKGNVRKSQIIKILDQCIVFGHYLFLVFLSTVCSGKRFAFDWRKAKGWQIFLAQLEDSLGFLILFLTIKRFELSFYIKILTIIARLFRTL